MSSEDDRLLRIAKAVSDSEAVDWSEAQAKANDPEERELVRLLRDISHVTELQRTRTRHAARESRAPQGPSIWGQLQLGEKLGEGAAAQVFRARDSELDREVALKLFHHDERIGPAQRHALLLEGRNLAQLRHENVVTVLGAAEHDGRVGIWMELVEGRTLSEIVKKEGPFSATEATQMGIELCGALAAVHRKQLVHGDIKAQNVKREAGGRTVLMDFSSSRGADESPGNPESDPAGTPLYMAPELWQGATPSRESDLYALGVLLYYLVTAHFPVRGTRIESLRRAHENGEHYLLRDERQGLSDVFVRAVEKALRRNPEERFASAGALEEALREVVAVPVPKIETVETATPEPASSGTTLALFAGFGLTAGGVVFLTFLGFITNSAFRMALHVPPGFSTDSLADHLGLGVQAMIPVVYYSAWTFLALAGLYIVVRASLALRRRFFASPSYGVEPFMDRFFGTDPSMFVAGFFVAGALMLAGVTWTYWDIHQAWLQMYYADSVTSIDVTPLGADAWPSHQNRKAAYSAALLLLTIGGVLLLVQLKRRGSPAGIRYILCGGLATLLLLGSTFMVIPYRLLWQNESHKVQFNGRPAYVVGQHNSEVFLFIPTDPSKSHHIVRDTDPRLDWGDERIVADVFEYLDEP